MQQLRAKFEVIPKDIEKPQGDEFTPVSIISLNSDRKMGRDMCWCFQFADPATFQPIVVRSG